jgi:Transcription factor WhiB
VLNLTWHDKAACKGQDTSDFFVDEFEQPEIIARLKRLCSTCPVFEQCLDHAVMWEEFGLWANMTESERRVHKRRLGIIRRSVSRASGKSDDYGFINRDRIK